MKWVYASLGWIALGFSVGWIVRRLTSPPGPKPEGRSYRISDDGKAITCRRCGRTSYHPEDVRQVYCGACHLFHVR
jgi:ribosomal protein S27AE